MCVCVCVCVCVCECLPRVSSLSIVTIVTVADPAIMLPFITSRHKSVDSPSFRVNVVTERLTSAKKDMFGT